ncbi:DUF86 domain-containing protein [Acidiferrimicrobium sp. IK]|uniref:HepT-like ribonuclease domain-containing protein n=1 Tax=Acidiferrimicrobium sp. IK TaxID=2871700 RepID=UPI0021CB3726|nr:HepT-like ribonuclease domain-containing protein [Acidiferrimicrobium sp. IK]
MRRSAEEHLRYIKATAALVEAETRRIGRARWMADEQVRTATYYRLHTVAESAKVLPDEVKGRHPEVPWRAMTAMRNRLVHDHLDVDPGIVWSVATEDLPRLGAVAAAELVRSPTLSRANGRTQAGPGTGRVAGVTDRPRGLTDRGGALTLEP